MRGLLVCLVFIALGGCEGTQTKSSYVKTSGFSVSYVVEQKDSASPRALAQFFVQKPGGALLELVDGDAVACDGVALTPATTDDGVPDYAGALVDVQSHVFELSRTGESTVSTTVPAPPALHLTSGPLDGGADSQYTIAWEQLVVGASNTRISLVARTQSPNCQKVTLSADGADTGTFAFDGSAFKTLDGGAPDCLYVIDVSRQTIATLGPPFAGGDARARAIRTTTLHLH